MGTSHWGSSTLGKFPLCISTNLFISKCAFILLWLNIERVHAEEIHARLPGVLWVCASDTYLVSRHPLRAAKDLVAEPSHYIGGFY